VDRGSGGPQGRGSRKESLERRLVQKDGPPGIENAREEVN
jgi:hypothetical protein